MENEKYKQVLETSEHSVVGIDRSDNSEIKNEKNVQIEKRNNNDLQTQNKSENNSSESEMNSEDHVKTSDIKSEEDQTENIELGSDEWFIKDQEKFKSTYPDVKSEELFSNPIFLEFAEKRAGVESMVDIYETYLSVSRRIEAKVMEKAEREFKMRLANANASPGSLTESTNVSDRLYTFEELRRMSPEAIERNWQKVQKSIKSFGK